MAEPENIAKKEIQNFILGIEAENANLKINEKSKSSIDPLSNHPNANKKADITVTFLTANMGTSEGLYKNLIPAVSLSLYSKKVRTFIANIQEVDPSKIVSDYEYWLSREMIEDSDYIVLPFMTEDITGLVELIREIRKDVGKEVKIAYQVDAPIFANKLQMPVTMAIKKTLNTKSGKDIILNNCNISDFVFFSNEVVKNSYIEYVKDNKIKTNAIPKTFMCYPMEDIIGRQWQYFQQPKILADFINPREEAIAEKFPKPDNALRFGMFLSPDNAYILDEFMPIMKLINEKWGNRIQFVIIGLTGENKDAEVSLSKLMDKNGVGESATGQFMRDKIMPKLPANVVYFCDRVPSHTYHSLPYILNLDAAILFAKDNKFNQSNLNYIKFFEMCYMRLPVLASNIYPYTKVIRSGDNGILISNDPQYWMQEIENLLIQLDSKEELQNNYKLTSIADVAYHQATMYDASKMYADYETIFV